MSKYGARVDIPPGAIREMEQYSVEPGTQLRWDIAWQDPASGWITQVGVDGFINPDHPQTEMFDVREMLRETARATLRRWMEQRCGVVYAIANQHPLPLPPCVIGRYI